MSGCMRRIGGLPRSARHFPISWSTRRKSVLISMRSFFRDGLGLEKIDRDFSSIFVKKKKSRFVENTSEDTERNFPHFSILSEIPLTL